MEFTSLGSGSSGNATVIRTDQTLLLIDCGFSNSEIERRLSHRYVDIENLDAVLVTHEHGDHMRGVDVLARKQKVPVYASRGTIEAILRRSNKPAKLLPMLHEIEANSPFRIKDITVFPIDVPHDVSEPIQYVCRCNGVGVGVLTDCGSFSEAMVSHYASLNGLLLETNHDEDMLRTGPYPEDLKRRVGGQYGHLNNRQSRDFAGRIYHTNLQHLVLGHISLQNNERSLIEREFDDFPSGTAVSFATQADGTEWLGVSSGHG